MKKLNLQIKKKLSTKKPGLFLVMVSSFILIGCNSGKEQYKSEIVFNFVASCAQQGTSVKQCGCIMDSVMNDLTQEEYISLETEMTTSGSLPEKLTKTLGKARSTCL